MIKTLRLLALLEGISTILLFGLAMPLKYIWHYDKLIFPIGLSHGVLFIGYCASVVILSWEMKWKFRITFLSLLASLIPGGTFYVDYKYFKSLENFQTK